MKYGWIVFSCLGFASGNVYSDGTDSDLFVLHNVSPTSYNLSGDCKDISPSQFKKANDLFELEKATPIWKEPKKIYEFGMDSKDTVLSGRFLASAYEVGTVKGGKNKGFKLILVSLNAHEEDNEPGGGNTDSVYYLRYLKKEGQFIYLPKMSQTILSMGIGAPENVVRGVAKALSGKEDIPKDDLTVLEFGDPIQLLKFRNVCLRFHKGVYDLSPNNKLSLVKTGQVHPVFGDVYKSGKFLYLMLPDQTLLAYYLIPSMLQGKMLLARGPYECFERPDKREPDFTAELVRVETALTTSALQKLGDVPGLGMIYGREGEQLKVAYQSYLEAASTAYSSQQPLVFEEFKKSNPIIYWKDPFGRLLFCENTSISVPYWAEPLIYLYPKHPGEKVSIEFLNPINVLKSEPSVRNRSWAVIADPDSTIRTFNDSKVYPNLFWEGQTGFFPLPNQGTVIAQEEVRSYLTDSLTSMGLNENERGAFLKYWVPILEQYPYVLIHFYDPKSIDKMAPLQIKPKPDSLIRVHMDYRPLERFEEFPPSPLPVFEKRKGFTVVEWGGMRR